MSTRATYEIDGEVFYCHYDGYPAGALGRFAEALRMRYRHRNGGCIQSNPGGMPYAFIRGAHDAAPAKTHECHGDTEYRYICYTGSDGMTLRIDLRCFERDKFYAIYNGSLAAAVNLFIPGGLEHTRFWNDPANTRRLLTAETLEAHASWMRNNPHASNEQADAYSKAAANARSGVGTRAAFDEIRHYMQLHHLSHHSAVHLSIYDPFDVAAE